MNTTGVKNLTINESRSYIWPALPRLLGYLGIHALTFGLVSLLWRRPVILTLIYVLLSVVMLWRWHAFSDVLYFFLAAVLGPLGEFIAISFGAWEYSLPLFNIPLWLPLAWGIAALCLIKMAETLIEARAATAKINSPELQ